MRNWKRLKVKLRGKLLIPGDSAGGAYVNMMKVEGEGRIKASYRDNYDRLVKIKTKYDPENLFRVNQNIKPA